MRIWRVFIELEKVLSNKGLAQKQKHSSDSRRIRFHKIQPGFDRGQITQFWKYLAMTYSILSHTNPCIQYSAYHMHFTFLSSIVRIEPSLRHDSGNNMK